MITRIKHKGNEKKTRFKKKLISQITQSCKRELRKKNPPLREGNLLKKEKKIIFVNTQNKSTCLFETEIHLACSVVNLTWYPVPVVYATFKSAAIFPHWIFFQIENNFFGKVNV